MARIYMRTDRKPIPANATLTQASKPIPKGADVKDGVATWTDREGCQRSAIINEDGTRIRMVHAEWCDSSGRKSAPVDHTEKSILAVQKNYTADFTVGDRRVRKSTKVCDKAVAQRIANRWEEDERKRSEGIIDEIDQSLSEHAALPISKHVDAFIAFRATDGGTEAHRDRTRKHIVEFISAGEWRSVRDINADDVTLHVSNLRNGGKSARTIQARLQSIKSFAKWLFEHHRIKINPLAKIKRPNPDTDRKHERRMLLPEEWEWLERSLQPKEIGGTGFCNRGKGRTFTNDSGGLAHHPRPLARFAQQHGTREGR